MKSHWPFFFLTTVSGHQLQKSLWPELDPLNASPTQLHLHAGSCVDCVSSRLCQSKGHCSHKWAVAALLSHQVNKGHGGYQRAHEKDTTKKQRKRGGFGVLCFWTRLFEDIISEFFGAGALNCNINLRGRLAYSNSVIASYSLLYIIAIVVSWLKLPISNKNCFHFSTCSSKMEVWLLKEMRHGYEKHFRTTLYQNSSEKKTQTLRWRNTEERKTSQWKKNGRKQSREAKQKVET